jgi:hypothetical protein
VLSKRLLDLFFWEFSLVHEDPIVARKLAQSRSRDK